MVLVGLHIETVPDNERVFGTLGYVLTKNRPVLRRVLYNAKNI